MLLGDPDQLQPIEAGTPFSELVARTKSAHLTEIHRQKMGWQKNASKELADGDIVQALARYRDHGAVTETSEHSDALDTLVETYAIDALQNLQSIRLAFAHRRKDVYALNQGIRAALRDDPEHDVVLETDTGPRAFGPGDRNIFGKNDKALGVKNSMLGTVEYAEDGKLKVALDGKARRIVSFDPSSYQSFDHGYAVTIHKSQGATVDAAYVLASRSMDRHLAYVAMTRHREELQVYTSAEDAPRTGSAPLGQGNRQAGRIDHDLRERNCAQSLRVEDRRARNG